MTGWSARLAGLAAAALTGAAFCCRAQNENPAAELQVGRAALEDGQYGVARKHLERYIAAASASVEPRDLAEPVALLARAMYEQKAYGDILRLLAPGSRAIRDIPRNGAFVFWRAMALYGEGRAAEALKETEGFDRQFPGDAWGGRVLRLRGWCEAKEGRAERAIALFEQFDRERGDSEEGPQNLLEWARALAGAGRAEEALAALARLAGLPAALPAAQEGRRLAAALRARRLEWPLVLQAAGPLCTNAAAPDDLRAEAWLAVAEAQEALGNGAAATNAAHAAAATARSASIRRKGGLALGRALLQMGRIEEGAGRLRAEIAADPGAPEAPDAQMRIAGAMLARGMPEQALEQFQHFLETFTNVTGQAEAHRGKGWALSRLNRHAEAATEFGRAQALFADPTNRCQCQLKVADSEFSGGQYEQAASSYRKLVESFPGCEFVPQAMFQAGECMARLEKPAEAERAFGELSERYPKSPLAAEAQLRLAEIKAGQGRFDEAIAAFDRVMGTRSNDVFFARALHGRGMARYGLFQFDGALADFERVLAGFRGTEMGEQAYYMRGMCLYWQGRDEEAAAVWRSFIRAHPDSRWAPEVLFWSAKFEFNRGAHEAAEGLFLSFADKYPASPLADDALLRAATAATRRAEYQRATEMLGRLVKDYPHSDKMAEARFAQADALSQLAKHAAAILVLDEIIARNPDSDLIPAVWGRKGDCNFVLGADDPARYAQSLECYRATVANPKASLDLLLQAEYKIGRCLEKMGRADEALEQYYVNVILRYFADREKGVWHSEAAKVWFARAAFNAAALYEGQKEWRQAVKVLDRIVAAGVDGEEEARARIARIRSEQWWLFR